jgi:GNAT superfamily N-acetyltransferase
MLHEVTTTYLEMRTPGAFKPRTSPVQRVCVEKIEIPTPTLNHYFFVHVGRPWRWYSRLSWTLADWKAWAEKETVGTWMGRLQGSPFGYIEIERQGSDAELSFIGLLPQFIGKGLGGFLLSEAIRIAWELNPKRVWVHTCTLDHPHALSNYLARGFSIYCRETKQEQVPEDDDPVWCTPAFYRSLTTACDALIYRKSPDPYGNETGGG